MSDLFWLSDAQMARIEPFFPKSHGKPRVDDKRVLSGIIFINRNGLRWRDAPSEYGPAKTLYNRWKRLLSGMLRMPCRATGATKVYSPGCCSNWPIKATRQTRS